MEAFPTLGIRGLGQREMVAAGEGKEGAQWRTETVHGSSLGEGGVTLLFTKETREDSLKEHPEGGSICTISRGRRGWRIWAYRVRRA